MVRRRRPLLVQLATELIPALRKRVEPCDAFEIDEVIRLLSVLQGKLCRIAPAIWLRTEIGDLNGGSAQKSRHRRRNALGSNPADVGVTFIAPGKGRIVLKKNEGDQR